jgi:hypothetical protein
LLRAAPAEPYSPEGRHSEGSVKTGFRVCGHWLALGLGLATLLGCGPEPVDGEPFVDPSRGPFVMPQSGTGGSSSAGSDDPAADDSAEKSTTLSDSQNQPVCCRICLQGKACGDTCIAPELTCQAAPGCACDG